MPCLRQIVLRLHSNIARYELTLYGECERISKQIYGLQDCVCLCTRSPYLRILASPLTEGYTTKLYFWVDIRCQNALHLHFNFPSDATPPPTPTVNQFTLTDANYGLPIDGTLTFTQA